MAFLRISVAAMLTWFALPRAAQAASACKAGDTARIWLSPEQPVSGQPVYVMATARAAADFPDDAELWLNGVAAKGVSGAFWRSGVIRKAAGRSLKVEVRSGGRTLACVQSALAKTAVRRAAHEHHWPTARAWDADHEAFYSAWVERLFAAAPDAALNFRPLAQALWDPERNWLHDHLRLGEDHHNNRSALKAAPDCADLPYLLRAYFAWKHQLPFAFRECDRGTSARPPRCPTLYTNAEPTKAKDPLGAFKAFVRLVVNKVHSGSLRTALDDDNTDFYPVPLTRQALRPGSVFADPYGHVLIVASWVDQPGKPGLLFAVDGQPDASITRKRFWEGNFLFATDVASAGAGFKVFRPLANNAVAQLSNKELKDHKTQPFDLTQAKLPADAFYLRMFELINPNGLNAEAAYDEMLAALVEQIEARSRSVDNGEEYMRQTNNRVVEMPEGPKIFETVGPWEDYATPSRDLRLLIAINVLEAFPARVTAYPKLFTLGGKSPTQVRGALEDRHRMLTSTREFAYTNSDGKPITLSIANLLARKPALQMAYNPNDCAEIRWGAPADSSERAACKREAPPEQRHRMETHRTWFAEARRPTKE